MPRTSAKVLTERSVQTAKAEPGQRLELWDVRSPGLCLRVGDKGPKIWAVRYRTLDGRQPRMKLGTAGSAAGDLSLAEARDRASEVRRLARDGIDPAARKKQEKAQAEAQAIRTVGDLADSFFTKSENGTYRATRAGKKAETIAGERRLWAFRLERSLGDRALDDVTRGDIRAVIEGIAEEAPIQSNRARALLRSMFNFAIREERLSTNPVSGVMALAAERARDRVLTDEEIRRLWKALLDFSGLRLGEEGKPIYASPAVRIALRLSLLTLQRRTEVAGMRLDELRLDEASWTISGSRTKNGKVHLVPLSPPAVELIKDALALREADEPSPFVFVAPWKKLRGKPIEGGALSHALSDIYKAVGIQGANLHDLRRTGASAMASERLLIPPIVISRVLSHTADGGGGALITARHYAVHDYVREKRAALEAWAVLLGTIVSNQEEVEAG